MVVTTSPVHSAFEGLFDYCIRSTPSPNPSSGPGMEGGIHSSSESRGHDGGSSQCRLNTASMLSVCCSNVRKPTRYLLEHAETNGRIVHHYASRDLSTGCTEWKAKRRGSVHLCTGTEAPSIVPPAVQKVSEKVSATEKGITPYLT
jgi:hypothetical protein